MKRVPEHELMEEEEQARAYAYADFSEPHDRFIEFFRQTFPQVAASGSVIDLGCGPGDIAVRFARAFPGCRVLGIDGSEAMLNIGREILSGLDDVRERVELARCRLPGDVPGAGGYDAIICNSLLHHLQDPAVLWQTIKECGRSGAPVMVMDLMRPVSPARARQLTDRYMAGEPPVLKRDFHASLLSAYEAGEVIEQLRQAELDEFTVVPASDRHLVVSGILPWK